MGKQWQKNKQPSLLKQIANEVNQFSKIFLYN